jgi:hypothetical protein
MANLDLLKKIHERIITVPEEWDQDTWAAHRECGTSYCIAGWACVLSGYKVDFDTRATHYSDNDVEAAYLTTGEDIADKGAALLDLDEYDTGNLFYCTNNAAALDRLENLIRKLEQNA